MLQDKEIAWVGLGKLGLPMAARIAAAGFRIAGTDRDQSRETEAQGRGLPISTLVSAATAAICFTSLPDDVALEAVYLGPDGLIAKATPDTILVDTSTVSIAASERVATACTSRSVRYLCAPVSGNPVLAESGQLSCICSGSRPAYDLVLPLMQTFARSQSYLGPEAQARYAKLAVNLMIAVSAGMLAEALLLAKAGGLDRAAFLDVLAESAVASPMVKYKLAPLKAHDYRSTFSGEQMAKDLDLILAAASASEIALPHARLSRTTYAEMQANGLGEHDYIATVLHAEQVATRLSDHTAVQAGGA